MAALRGATSASLVDSQWSDGNRGRETATPIASTEPTTPRELDECLWTKLHADLDIIAAHFAREKSPLQTAQSLKRVHDAAEKLMAKPEPTSIE